MSGAAARGLYATLHAVALPTLICWFRFRAFGRAHVRAQGGAIIAANHQSFLDPVFVGAAAPRPIDYFARRSLFRGPFGAFIRALNALPVERREPSRESERPPTGGDVAAIRTAIERLRAGRILLLFPEGTRTATGALGPFRSGVETIARRAGVPVIPAAIDGAFEAWPRGRPIFRAGAPCAVAFGPPLPPEAPDLLADLRAEILRLQAFLRARRPFRP